MHNALTMGPSTVPVDLLKNTIASLCLSDLACSLKADARIYFEPSINTLS